MSTNLLAVPPALRPGDAISIVAPASSPKRDVFDAAMANLTTAGYRPKTYRDVCKPHGYLAGSDAERADELNQALADPETTMVLAARGGYGCGRILDRIDFDLLKKRPKIVCGYSDLTALHAAIQRRCGLVSFHCPNLVDGLGDVLAETELERAAAFSLVGGETAVRADLFGSFMQTPVTPITLFDGDAEGRLVGGNAAVLLSVLGTPFAPDFEGAILLLEDVGEAPYRVDRLLTQLRLGGALDRLAGVMLGYFTGTGDSEGPAVEEIAREFFAPRGIPALAAVPVGHEHPNLPVPLGARVRLDAEARTLCLAQSVVRG